MSKIEEICQSEGIKYKLPSLKKLIEISEGDLRKSITTLQSCSTLNEKTLTMKSIVDSSGLIPNETISNLTLLIYRF